MATHVFQVKQQCLPIPRARNAANTAYSTECVADHPQTGQIPARPLVRLRLILSERYLREQRSERQQASADSRLHPHSHQRNRPAAPTAGGKPASSATAPAFKIVMGHKRGVIGLNHEMYEITDAQ